MQRGWARVREGAKEPVNLVSGALVGAAAIGILGTGVFVVGSSFADTLPTPRPTATSTASPKTTAKATPRATASVSPSATSTSSQDAH